MKRTQKRLFIEPARTHPAFTQKWNWTPEIRMLDKDERLAEPTMETKLRDAWKLGFHPNISWPPMDPLNPTKEQRRASNTAVGQYQYQDYVQPAHVAGFRTIPPELIDWRSTMYGDLGEELPHLNERMTFALPDYTLAGLVYSDKETIAMSDSVPRTVDKAGFGKVMSPKIEAWVKYVASKNDLNPRWTWTRIFTTLACLFFCYKVNQIIFRQHEVSRRQQRSWWDGANSGTWKYGGGRQMFANQALTGGSVIPILEW